MANISIKRVCLDAIANYIANNVTGLSGKVSVVAAGPETMAPCLSVKLIADSFTFEPSEPDEVYWNEVTDDKQLVYNVGSFTGMISIQLYAINPAERELYEQKIIDLFLRTKWAPGTIFVTTPTLTVDGYPSLYSAEIKARLDGEEWNDEFAFESKRFSFLDIYVDYPALALDNDAPTIESLQVWLSEDPIDSLIIEEG